MALTREEAKEIGHIVAETVLGRFYGIPEVTFHIIEHEVAGHALMVDPVKAKDPTVPGKCFSYDKEEYCWKPGYLGLISSRKNPEQHATVVVKEPAGAGVAERFRKVKGAVTEAHKEWEKVGGGLRGWWQQVGEKLTEAGIEL